MKMEVTSIMKIWYQSAAPLAKEGETRDYYNALKKHASNVAGPDVQVHIQGTTRIPKLPINAYEFYSTKYVNANEILTNIVRAEREGYDVAAIGCLEDPVLLEAKELVNMPVVSSGESAMLFSCMLGHKFSLVCFMPKQEPILEDNIRKHGLESRVASIEQMNITPEELYRIFVDPKPAINKFMQASARAIEKGAEVIIPACNTLSLALVENGVGIVGDTGVPILDTQAVLLRTAIMVAELRKISGLVISRKLKYASPAKEYADKLFSSC